jgi:hypothetical protein
MSSLCVISGGLKTFLRSERWHCFSFIIVLTNTFAQTFILSHSPRFSGNSSLLSRSKQQSSSWAARGRDLKPGIAFQQASALPSVLHCILNELPGPSSGIRGNLTELRCTLIELRCTLTALSCCTLFLATLHPF